MPDIVQAEDTIPSTRIDQPGVVDIDLSRPAFRAYTFRQRALERRLSWLIELLSGLWSRYDKLDTACWAETCVGGDLGLADMALHGRLLSLD
jgi:hypothetical protein